MDRLCKYKLHSPNFASTQWKSCYREGGDLHAESYIILCHASCVDEEDEEDDFEEGDNDD